MDKPIMDHTTLELIVTIFASIAASSGFWLILGKAIEKRSSTSKLMLGLAHDRIVCLSLDYIETGCITHDQFDTLYRFLYQPYIKMGGNGTVVKLMRDIERLPIHTNPDPNVHDNRRDEDR